MPVAHAQNTEAAPVYPFRVVFSAPDNCGSADLFSRQLRRRTQRLRPARALDQGVTFFIYVVESEGSVRGQLGVGQPDGSLSFREVPGVNCAEVIDAMALIAALTFDLAANTQALPPPPPEFEKTEPPAPEKSDAETDAKSRWGFELAARAGVRSALSPEAALTGTAELAVTHLSSRLQPGVRLAAVAARGPELSRSAGDAQFTLVTARLSGCPTRWSLLNWWSVTPCAWAELGLLNGEGSRIPVVQSTSTLWSAAGVALHSELQLAGPLWAAAELSGFFPLRRDSFYFQPRIPENELFGVPSAGGLATLGLGLRFF